MSDIARELLNLLEARRYQSLRSASNSEPKDNVLVAAAGGAKTNRHAPAAPPEQRHLLDRETVFIQCLQKSMCLHPETTSHLCALYQWARWMRLHHHEHQLSVIEYRKDFNFKRRQVRTLGNEKQSKTTIVHRAAPPSVSPDGLTVLWHAGSGCGKRAVLEMLARFVNDKGVDGEEEDYNVIGSAPSHNPLGRCPPRMVDLNLLGITEHASCMMENNKQQVKYFTDRILERQAEPSSSEGGYELYLASLVVAFERLWTQHDTFHFDGQVRIMAVDCLEALFEMLSDCKPLHDYFLEHVVLEKLGKPNKTFICVAICDPKAMSKCFGLRQLRQCLEQNRTDFFQTRQKRFEKVKLRHPSFGTDLTGTFTKLSGTVFRWETLDERQRQSWLYQNATFANSDAPGVRIGLRLYSSSSGEPLESKEWWAPKKSTFVQHWLSLTTLGDFRQALIQMDFEYPVGLFLQRQQQRRQEQFDDDVDNDDDDDDDETIAKNKVVNRTDVDPLMPTSDFEAAGSFLSASFWSNASDHHHHHQRHQTVERTLREFPSLVNMIYFNAVNHLHRHAKVSDYLRMARGWTWLNQSHFQLRVHLQNHPHDAFQDLHSHVLSHLLASSANILKKTPAFEEADQPIEFYSRRDATAGLRQRMQNQTLCFLAIQSVFDRTIQQCRSDSNKWSSSSSSNGEDSKASSWDVLFEFQKMSCSFLPRLTRFGLCASWYTFEIDLDLLIACLFPNETNRDTTWSSLEFVERCVAKTQLLVNGRREKEKTSGTI